MKDYDPEKMISDSRFSVLFADSDKAMQEKVLSRIGRLVRDNRPYADDKNYGFCATFSPRWRLCSRMKSGAEQERKA